MHGQNHIKFVDISLMLVYFSSGKKFGVDLKLKYDEVIPESHPTCIGNWASGCRNSKLGNGYFVGFLNSSLTGNRIPEMSGFMPVQQMHAVAPLS